MSNFKLIQKINGAEIRAGDNCLLVEKLADGTHKYYASNDTGEWRELDAVLVDVVEPEPPVDPKPPVDPEPEPEPEPPVDADATPATLAGLLAPGVTLTLAAGDYGQMPDLPDGVTLIGGGDAVFSGYNLDADGLTLIGLVFRAHFDSQNDSARPFRTSGSGLTFTGCLFEGNILSNGLPTGRGPRFEGGSNIVFERNTVRRFAKNMALVDVDGAQIIDCEISEMSADGLVIGGFSKNIIVEGGRIHDRIKPPPGVNTHGDMLVVQRSKDQFTENLTFRNIVIDYGRGGSGQSFYLANDGDGTTSKNILVDGLVIYGSHVNGIFGSNVDGLTVRNCTLLQMQRNAGDEPTHNNIDRPKFNLKDMTNFVMEGNIAPNYGDESPAGENNLVLAKDDYDAVFDRVLDVERGDDQNEWYFKAGQFPGFGSPLMRR